EQSRGFNDQKRAKPLAAAKGCVTHGFHQPRGPRDLPSKRLGVQQRVQELLDISSGLIEPRLKGYFLLRTHERNLAGRVLLPTLFLTQCIEYVRVLVPKGWPGGAIRRSGGFAGLVLLLFRARGVLQLGFMCSARGEVFGAAPSATIGPMRSSMHGRRWWRSCRRGTRLARSRP